MAWWSKKADGSPEAGEVDEADEEMEVVASMRMRIVECQGERLEIRPLTIGQLPGFAKEVRPIIDVLNDLFNADGFSLESVVGLIEDHGDQLVAAAAAAVGRDPGWMSETPADEFTELVVAVFAMNLDFFVQRLLLRFAADVTELLGHVRALSGSGPIPSSSSSTPATH